MDNENGLTISMGEGVVTCSAGRYPKEQGLTGTVRSNDESTDEISITKAFGDLGGAGPCESSVPLGPSVEIKILGGRPLATLSLGSNLRAALKTKSSRERLYMDFDFGGGKHCRYYFTRLTDGVVGLTGLLPGHLRILFEGDKLKLEKHLSARQCAEQALLSAEFQTQVTDVFWIVFARLS